MPTVNPRYFSLARVGLPAAALLSYLGAVAAYGMTPVRFKPATVYNLAGSGPKALAVANFDGASGLDIAGACNGNSEDPVGEVGVNLNDGAGHLGSDNPFGPAILPWGVAAGDFNGDGRPDLAVTDGRAASSGVQIFLGNGSGGFALHATLAANAFPVAVVAAYFNADDRLDLAVVGNTGNQLSIFHGQGGGDFTRVQNLAVGPALGLAAGDIDGDGRTDLVVATYGGAQAFMCGPTGLFVPGASAGGTELTQAVALGDVDGDGKLDVAAAELYSGRVRVRYGIGGGAFGAGVTRPAAWPTDARLVDLNKDGRAELVVAQQDGNSVRVYMSDGGGLASTPLDSPVGAQPAALAIADFDGDGWPDVACALRNYGDASLLAVLLQQPLGDLNCDGAVDFADIDPFVIALSGPAGYAALYPGCDWANADINWDGAVDFADIDAFVARLGGQ